MNSSTRRATCLRGTYENGQATRRVLGGTACVRVHVERQDTYRSAEVYRLRAPLPRVAPGEVPRHPPRALPLNSSSLLSEMVARLDLTSPLDDHGLTGRDMDHRLGSVDHILVDGAPGAWTRRKAVVIAEDDSA